MQIDESAFPLVFLRPHDTPTDDFPAEARLEAIFDREERFALITTFTSVDDHDDSPAEERRKALFFKRNRDRFRRFCAGAIVIEGDRPAPVPVRLAAHALGKAFGFDFYFVPTEADAIDRATRLVQRPAA